MVTSDTPFGLMAEDAEQLFRALAQQPFTTGLPRLTRSISVFPVERSDDKVECPPRISHVKTVGVLEGTPEFVELLSAQVCGRRIEESFKR